MVVGPSEGKGVGLADGSSEVKGVGLADGPSEGIGVGLADGIGTGWADGPAEGKGVGFVDGPTDCEVVGFEEGTLAVETNPVEMITGNGEDDAFKSTSSGRKFTVTTSPAVDKEVATVSLISIQKVVVWKLPADKPIFEQLKIFGSKVSLIQRSNL